jgi:hypothetical protein
LIDKTEFKLEVNTIGRLLLIVSSIVFVGVGVEDDKGVNVGVVVEKTGFVDVKINCEVRMDDGDVGEERVKDCWRLQPKKTRVVNPKVIHLFNKLSF